MKYKSLKGFSDILGEDIALWQALEREINAIMRLYGYSEIRTPIVEPTELFTRSVGEATDVVGKEMYTFWDKGTPPESLALRPELTAPTARAYIQYEIAKQQQITKWYYVGQAFRYEQPQKGRSRQFHTCGVELLGAAGAKADTEVITLGYDLLKKIGINNFTLRINSLGNYEERTKYKQALVEYLSKYANDLSAESQRRIATNPLRVLDSKDSRDSEVIANSPSILDFLSTDSETHFSDLQECLQSSGVSFVVDNKLVRGLDYYTKTVFEFQTKSLGSQDALGGGGRYDNLISELGGTPTPATGFGFGLERLILAARLEQGLQFVPNKLDVYLVAMGEEAQKKIPAISHKIRLAGFSADYDLLNRSVKAQMKESNKKEARFAIIIGEQELKTNSVVLKNLETSEQKNISQEEILTEISC